jgi:hypothetical protein
MDEGVIDMLAFSAGFITAIVFLVILLFILCLLGGVDGEAYEKEVKETLNRNRAWD